MQLVEKFIMGKTGNIEICEDGIYYDSNFAAVVDGVSTKSNQLYDGKTTGYTAKEIILTAIKRFPKDISSSEASKILTEAIRKSYKNCEILQKVIDNPEERFSATAAIYSNYKKEVWIIGDCKAYLNGRNIMSESNLDRVAAEARALFIEEQLLKGKTVEDMLENDEGREFINPLLKNQAVFENDNNHYYGYGVINGIQEPIIKVYSVNTVEKKKFVALSTDGYPIIYESLVETEKHLKITIDKDPLRIKEYKSTKGIKKGNVSFDDRAYIRVEI